MRYIKEYFIWLAKAVGTMIDFIKNMMRGWLCPDCPVLRGEDAEEFLKRMKNPEPIGLVSTPKLDEAVKLILKDGEKNNAKKLY